MSLENRASGGQAVYLQVTTKSIRDIRKDSFPSGLPWVTDQSLPRNPQDFQNNYRLQGSLRCFHQSSSPSVLDSRSSSNLVYVWWFSQLVWFPPFFFSFLGIFPKSSYAFSLTLVFASCRIWFSFCNGHFQDYYNFCLLHSSGTYNRVRFPFFTLQC